MHVLIGTDGSDDALAAAERGVALLAAADQLSVVCVIEPPAAATAGLESGFSGGVAAPEAVDEAWSEAHAEASAALERTIGGVSTPAEVKLIVEIGSPGPTLTRLAEEMSCDVIVVGSRGRGAIKRALLGSISTHVVHNAPCPVLVVRQPAT
jgi:nucleotide-binding universal stress UspA family protein